MLNLMFQIFLCIKHLQDFVQIRLGKNQRQLDVIGIKNMCKRLQNNGLKIKYLFHQFMDVLINFFDLNHSHINTKCNPNAKEV